MTATDTRKDEIYRAFHAKVFGYIRGKINSAQDAEDLADEVFMKVFEKLDTFDETKASLSTWIYTITRNRLTDYFRTRRVFEEIPETLDDGSSVEEDVCNAEMLDILADALAHLDERERDIIILRYYSGKTLREIAVQMGISYAYIKVLQNKALDAMKKYFEK